MHVVITPSWKKNKKYAAVIITANDVKIVQFGDNRYEDFTIHKDVDRKSAYIKRHFRNEDWNNPFTAGFWSRWLLWNLPTIEESANNVEDKFGINLYLNISPV